MAENQGQLVLAQNQYAFIQDTTKGHVSIYAGPSSTALSQSDRPVSFDAASQQFVSTSSAQAATKQNPLVPEGHYIILENPAFNGTDNKLHHPAAGRSTPAAELSIGRKINIPGPATFALWPGQTAKGVPGHQLRSNQYLIVRVYNAEEANVNGDKIKALLVKEETSTTKNTAEISFNNGQHIVIKGTEVPFFIPPTGFEVVESESNYIREALTLERLEYCILLDENGNKRYERGPQVVFPRATERFVKKSEGGTGSSTLKQKAIELNDQMGLYIKVIAEYEAEVAVPEGCTEGAEFLSEKYNATCVVRDNVAYFKVGEELFITGEEQRIYYPRPEHALIEYFDPKTNFNRQKYYGIAIPKGEGRYILDKDKGEFQTVKGPQIFLPDPRSQVMVRRALDEKTVRLWYPGNAEALAFNATLRNAAGGTSYLEDASFLAAAADVVGARSLNRGTSYSKGISAERNAVTDAGNGAMQRGGGFVPPPMLTLDTKYDGVPAISIWTGYAVQVVNRSGARRIVVGPTTLLLDYDESLEVLTLSTGKPKTTDSLHRDVYLRVENNLVSDMVNFETKDSVSMTVKLSYRVNFQADQKEKWFNVENYVKFLCDHMRSLLKAEAKKFSVVDLLAQPAIIVRDTILGDAKEGAKRQRVFPENGMVITDVEVLGMVVTEQKIAAMLQAAQQKLVQDAITLTNEQQNLEISTKTLEVQSKLEELRTGMEVARQKLLREQEEARHETDMLKQQNVEDEGSAELEFKKAQEAVHSEIAAMLLERQKATDEQTLLVEAARTQQHNLRVAAITPNLVEAITVLGETRYLTEMSTAIAPLALAQQQGLTATMDALFEGTPVAALVNNLKPGAKARTPSKIPV
jgi:major vault protein